MASSKISNTSPSIKHRIAGWLFIKFFWVLSKFSLKNLHRLGSLVGWGLSLFPNYNRNVVRANLKVAYPQLSSSERLVMEKMTLKENAKSFTELGALWEWSSDSRQALVKAFYGKEHLEAKEAKGKGIILLTPHFGAWELLTEAIQEQELVTILYQPPKIKQIEDYIVQARLSAKGRAVPTNARGVKEIFKSLLKKQRVGILPDQDPGDTGSIYAPFFGHPARSMTLIAKLVRKTQATVVFIVAERLPNAEGFAIHILPADSEIYSEDDLVSVMALNKGVEACVAINPTQYLWSYKRYRHPPAGTEDIY